MEHQRQQKQSKSSNPPVPPFLEVRCSSSGKVRRFAAGTNARYALHIINRKLRAGAPMALHIEAVKEREEPVSFGPAALLVDYGDDWKLQTITEQDCQDDGKGLQKQYELQPPKNRFEGAALASTLMYAAKIILAFIFIFFLGAIFAFFLEKLPNIIAFATSSMSLFPSSSL